MRIPKELYNECQRIAVVLQKGVHGGLCNENERYRICPRMCLRHLDHKLDLSTAIMWHTAGLLELVEPSGPKVTYQNIFSQLAALASVAAMHPEQFSWCKREYFEVVDIKSSMYKELNKNKKETKSE